MTHEEQGLSADTLRQKMREFVADAQRGLDNEHADRQLLLEELVERLQRLAGPELTHATVITFKPSGKYYTEHSWRIPENAIGPLDMRRSPDFQAAQGWYVLVPTQEPWGYPHLIVGE